MNDERAKKKSDKQGALRKEQIKRILTIGINVLFGIGVIVLAISLILSIKTYNEVNTKNKKLETQITELQKENAQLKEQQASLETKEEIERVARKELGLVKPGEVPYVK